MSGRLEYHTRTGLTLSQSQPGENDANWIPNTDIYESEDRSHIFVTMELAGAAIEHLEISLKDRVLTVSGDRPDLCRKEKCEFQQMEIDYGHFERKLRIPSSVAGHLATARYSNGFLVIDLPKALPGEPKEIVFKDKLTILIVDR